jgi:hypothetical protein
MEHFDKMELFYSKFHDDESEKPFNINFVDTSDKMIYRKQVTDKELIVGLKGTTLAVKPPTPQFSSSQFVYWTRFKNKLNKFDIFDILDFYTDNAPALTSIIDIIFKYCMRIYGGEAATSIGNTFALIKKGTMLKIEYFGVTKYFVVQPMQGNSISNPKEFVAFMHFVYHSLYYIGLVDKFDIHYNSRLSIKFVRKILETHMPLVDLDCLKPEFHKSIEMCYLCKGKYLKRKDLKKEILNFLSLLLDNKAKGKPVNDI